MRESRFKEVRVVRRDLQELVIFRVFRLIGRRRKGEGKPYDGLSCNKKD